MSKRKARQQHASLIQLLKLLAPEIKALLKESKS